MTLILTVNGKDSIWLLADRRLTIGSKVIRDDAIKVMCLDTVDGEAIIGYAGLGATAYGTEPSEWLSSVLRGRNLPLEESLGVIAEAMRKEFPKHLVNMASKSVPIHDFLITAFQNNELRTYSIDMQFSPNRKEYFFRYTRQVANHPKLKTNTPPRIFVAGSGGFYLMKNRSFVKPLLHVIKANDQLKISSQEIADYLAKINYQVHLGMNNNTVGPNCIVVWKHKKGGIHKGGGGHSFYSGVQRDQNTLALPNILLGNDMKAFINVLWPYALKMRELNDPEKFGNIFNQEEINEILSHLPDEPDDNLQ